MLANNPAARNLTTLLCHPACYSRNANRITLNDLKGLCESKHLKKLSHLRLRLTELGDAGVQEAANEAADAAGTADRALAEKATAAPSAATQHEAAINDHRSRGPSSPQLMIVGLGFSNATLLLALDEEAREFLQSRRGGTKFV